jgi:hypothetical protein
MLATAVKRPGQASPEVIAVWEARLAALPPALPTQETSAGEAQVAAPAPPLPTQETTAGSASGSERVPVPEQVPESRPTDKDYKGPVNMDHSKKSPTGQKGKEPEQVPVVPAVPAVPAMTATQAANPTPPSNARHATTNVVHYPAATMRKDVFVVTTVPHAEIASVISSIFFADRNLDARLQSSWLAYETFLKVEAAKAADNAKRTYGENEDPYAETEELDENGVPVGFQF